MKFISKKFRPLNLFYKSKLITYDDESVEIQNTELINCLDGYLEDKYGDMIYLLNGTWYVFDKLYIDIINKQFQEIYDSSKKYILDNIDNFRILKETYEKHMDKNKDKPTESIYNKEFKDIENVIYADKQLVDNVEIADLIIPDTKNKILYLLCLKEKFNGHGCRDLYGQIKISYQLLQNKLKNNIQGALEEYLEKLNRENEKPETINWDEYRHYFQNYTICYVAGFMKGLKEKTDSNYAKHLSYALHKELNNNRFEFVLMDFSFEIYMENSK